MSALGDWAMRNIDSLLNARLRELERLRKLLDRDPDEGLRFAIPLRDVAYRGRGRPAWKLRLRDLSFNLRKLGGGSPIDPWLIPNDVRHDLLRRYREAANRELRLGRFRRAAYIFAELLGDFAGAASALEQGRHYREAAVLYRDHLKAPLKAAECLEHGGLLLEAIAFYEQLGRFEKAGDLYVRVERPEDAARCYRRQVAIHIAASAPLPAARLLETKLRSPDEALSVLDDAWPHTDPNGAALRESFALLGRLLRHDQTADRLRHLSRHPPPFGRELALVNVLSNIARTYPQEIVRRDSADLARVFAGWRMEEDDTAEREQLSQAIAKLVPEDRLLARDAQRFISITPPKRPPIQKLRSDSDPVVLRRFQLTEGVMWHAVACIEEGFCAVGIYQAMLCFLRGRWDGASQRILHKPPILQKSPQPLSLHPVPGKSQVFVMPIDVLENPLTLTYYDTQFSCPHWLRLHPPFSVDHDERCLTWALSHDAIRVYASSDGRIVASHAIPQPPRDNLPLQLLARGGYAYAIWGDGILCHSPVRAVRVEKMPRPVRQLTGTLPLTPWRIAVAMSEGGMLLWADGTNKSFADGLFDPQISFTRGGMLVAADANQGRVYGIHSGDLRKRGEFACQGPLLAITHTSQLDEFACFTENGTVTVYKLPR